MARSAVPTVAVIGAGAWGTALAIVAARAGNRTVLWGRDPDQLDAMRRDRVNPKRLPGVALPAELGLEGDLDRLRDVDMMLLAVPAQEIRGIAERLASGTGMLVICAKGLERATGRRLSEVLRNIVPRNRIAALSGPSFAAEVASHQPTAVTVAAASLEGARRICEALATPAFRPYPSRDVVGVELGGAFKNVIAIAAGIAMGRGLGENARAAVVTRGLAELTRLGMQLGARRETLMGLSGLGDLILSATSLTSRNMRLGHDIGAGVVRPGDEAGQAPLAEGRWTAEAACRRALELGIELPIASAVQAVMENRISSDEAIRGLLRRPLPARE
jgi:glycerol-3-phosphate dehydrogenase (NAD(P)+)